MDIRTAQEPKKLEGALQMYTGWMGFLRDFAPKCIAADAGYIVRSLSISNRRHIHQTNFCRAFFAVLASVFVPPSLPVQLFIFVSAESLSDLCRINFTTQLMALLFIGLLFGWALGVAAMRAANAVRPVAYLQVVYTQVQSRHVASVIFEEPFTHILFQPSVSTKSHTRSHLRHFPWGILTSIVRVSISSYWCQIVLTLHGILVRL
jgi:hypothetical protein